MNVLFERYVARLLGPTAAADAATGYVCIVMRANPGGHLCGYVGLPSGHPLHGFAPEAIPAQLGVEVHGGIVYGRICEGGPTPERSIVREARRICHLPIARASLTHRSGGSADEAHAWWLGFECDHVADLVPDDRGHAERADAIGVAQVYRDEACLRQEVEDLTAQLYAIEVGESPLRPGPPLPGESGRRRTSSLARGSAASTSRP